MYKWMYLAEFDCVQRICLNLLFLVILHILKGSKTAINTVKTQ